MKNLSKKTISSIVGLLIAILTAVAGYLASSCSISRSTSINADSLHVQHVVVRDSIGVHADKLK